MVVSWVRAVGAGGGERGAGSGGLVVRAVGRSRAVTSERMEFLEDDIKTSKSGCG